MNRFILSITALIAASGSVVSSDAEIIIESYEDGYNSQWFSTHDGKWQTSVAKSAAPGLSASRTRFDDANATVGSARFTPDIPVAGKYEVFSTYPPSGSAAGIIYTVKSAEGEKVQNLDQNGRVNAAKMASNKWYSLGTYQFNKGADGYVEIKDPGTGENPNPKEHARIYADAVKFVPQGFELPADFKNQGGSGGGTGIVTASTPAPMPVLGAPESGTGSVDALPSLGAPPSSGSSGGAIASLPSLGTPAPSSSALPSLPGTTGSGSPSGAIPSLPDTSASGSSAGTTGLPVLGSPSSPGATAALPSLGATASSSDSNTGLPSLPGSSGAAGSATGLPSLGSSASGSTGLPQIPPAASSTPGSGTGLPSLSASTGLPSAPAGGTGLPHLSAAGATTPPAGIGSTGLPALGAVTGGSSGASSSLPSLGTATMPAEPQTGSSLPSIGSALASESMATPATMLSSAGPAQTFATAAQQEDLSGLQWMHDIGAARKVAGDTGKNVLVFFTAPGNRDVYRYQSEFFRDSNVRTALNGYVLVKVDFPQNTKEAYSMGVFQSAAIAITDPTGKKLRPPITQIKSPQELAEALTLTAK